jgi:hypothetical protein
MTVADERDPETGAGDCGVGEIAEDLRALYGQEPHDALAQAHLAAVFAAVDALAAEGLDRATDENVVDLGSRRRVGRTVFGAAAIGAAILTGGLAAAGELPPAVQQRVASLVAPAGIHLPSGRGSASELAPTTKPSVVPNGQDPFDVRPLTPSSAADRGASVDTPAPGAGPDPSTLVPTVEGGRSAPTKVDSTKPANAEGGRDGEVGGKPPKDDAPTTSTTTVATTPSTIPVQPPVMGERPTNDGDHGSSSGGAGGDQG